MVDAWLIVVVIILAAVLLVCMVVVVIVFGHPDDKNEAKFPKLVVIFGLWIAFASVLVLPYDVANSQGSGGGVDVGVLWFIIYITLAIFVVVIIPYAYFFYESDVDPADVQGFCDSQAGTALQYTLGFFVIFVTVCVTMYAYLNIADVPVTELVQSLLLVVPANVSIELGSQLQLNRTTLTILPGCSQAGSCQVDAFNWAIPVTFPVFLLCVLSFVGWWFWTFFVGVGLIALPVDLINDWRTRPVVMDFKSYIEQRERLGRRAKYLIDFGVEFQKQEEDTRHNKSRSEKRKDRERLLKFERAFYFLKQDKELLDACKKLKDTNPLWWAFKLFLGIVGFIISVTWLIHIAIFVLPDRPYTPFLNAFFIDLSDVGGQNGGFPLFGILAFSIYAFYLMWCSVKGNFKLGLRLVFWKIYPMEIGKTKMNAFLANTWIIMLCSVPTVQFCVRAFPIYARNTAIDVLFGTQIQYLSFFKYFFEENVFIIAMIVVSFLTLLYLIYRPRDRAQEVENELDSLAARSGGRKPDDDRV